MSGTATRFVQFGAGLMLLVTLGWVLTGQAARPAHHEMGYPTDWTHRHVIFSQPATPEQARRVENDPRYWQQWVRRNQPLVLRTDREEAAISASFASSLRANRSSRPTGKMHRDWAEDLGTLPASPTEILANVFPAKFSFSPSTANCGSSTTPDFVVFSTGLSGTGTQPNIVAYDNLYSGCGGTVPTLYWAYNVTVNGDNGDILTSPVFSRDGTQIAFVEHDTVTTLDAALVLLKWAAGTGTLASPLTLTSQATPADYRACTAPCMFAINLRARGGGLTDDTTSSVFYDYTNDIAWVGDGGVKGGNLHQFTGVFLGTPAEVTTAPWPVAVNSGAPLTSPVFDQASRSVFVGDGGGVLYRVDATTGAVTASGQLDFGTGFVSGPIVDVTNGVVYAFSSDDDSGACAVGADCAGVFQLSTGFATGDVGTEAPVGPGGTVSSGGTPPANPLYEGFFDNAYLNSANATGNAYVCGNTGANPTVYQIPINTGALGTPVAISALTPAADNPACSPLIDISIPGATAGSAATEHLFFSVQNNSNAAVCSVSGGCVENFNDTPWQAKTEFTRGQEILVARGAARLIFTDITSTSGATSGATQPAWPPAPGTPQGDGTITWINQGNPNSPLGTWIANHTFALHTRILDSNGNVEIVTAPSPGPGTSGGTLPTFPLGAGSTKSDGTLTWTNAGAFPSNALASAGGASGMIIDNTVGPGTLAGASNVYFTTLNNQTCATSGGSGGCAVQASQPALQ
jgi:hypothetical protein